MPTLTTNKPELNLTPIKALADNYIWLYQSLVNDTILVDPGSDTVVQYLKAHAIKPDVILLTHKHSDHIDGVYNLVKEYPEVKIYAAPEAKQALAAYNLNIKELELGSNQIANSKFNVLHTPGHTTGHYVIYNEQVIFTGDAIFPAGCGRLFEGTAEELFKYIQDIKQLNKELIVCSGHEYTVSNLNFALAVLKNNKDYELIQDFLQQYQSALAKNKVLLTTLEFESKINPYFKALDTKQCLDYRQQKNNFKD